MKHDGPKQIIELFFSILNLPSYDQNAYKVVIYLEDELLGETESQEGRNIHFATTFIVDYYLDLTQRVKFHIMPSSKTKTYIDQFDLGELAKEKTMSEEKKFIYGETNDKFSFVIHGEHYNIYSNTDKTLNYKFQDLRVIGIKYNEYYKIFFDVFNMKDKKFWRPMYQSETVSGQQNPIFQDFSLNKVYACSGNPDNKLRFVFYDQDRGYLGESIIIIKHILSSSMFPIFDSRDQKIGALQIKITEFKEVSNQQIMESLRFHSVVGIDFSDSNGIQTKEGSLHYIGDKDNKTRLNPYQNAIITLEPIMSFFNNFTMIPFFAFGGIPPGSSSPDFCSDLNRLAKQDQISGVKGLINVYEENVKLYIFSKPINVRPFFEHVLNTFIYVLNNNFYNYYVVWLFIDNDIEDFDSTSKLLENTWNYGISIIICGIGKARFVLMNELSKYLLN